MVDGGTQTVQWIGSMTLFPNAVDLGLPSTQLYRITEGSYGLDRSAPDLMLGAAARILPGLYAIDSSSNLINIDDLSDGHSVIKIRPMSAVQTFHIGLTNHGLMRANGIAVESFHPGSEPQTFLNQDLLGMYLALFPHVESLRDFGPLNHMRQR